MKQERHKQNGTPGLGWPIRPINDFDWPYAGPPVDGGWKWRPIWTSDDGRYVRSRQNLADMMAATPASKPRLPAIHPLAARAALARFRVNRDRLVNRRLRFPNLPGQVEHPGPQLILDP